MPLLQRKTRVHMLVSVNERAAGTRHRLPRELADQYILKGYATGKLTRPYSEQERVALTFNSQTVGA
jgi:hypothetical protein